MFKLILFTAIAANLIIFASSTGSVIQNSVIFSSSSSSSQSSSSSSSLSSSSTFNSSPSGSSTSTSSSSISSSDSSSSSSSASNYYSSSSIDFCKKCTQKHEVYSDCVNSGCGPRNCSQVGFPQPCVIIDPCECIPGCVCEDGYVRNAKGICVEKKNCPSCGGDPNAESGCGVFCQKCSNYGRETLCTLVCLDNSCECKPGFILDENINKCVKPCDCTPTCKANEVFSDCINGGCDARNCSQLGFPVPCVDPKVCIKGCVCKPDYLRADDGTCIPKTKCPSCGGDPNATSGCGVFCNQCRGPVPCPRICKVNACDCKPGFVYDSNTGKCVLREDCTPTCKDNEVFSNCTNGGCDARNCTQLGKPVPCIKRNPSDCIKGCVCDEGYLRAANGTCVPVKQCPSCNDDPNATSGCGVFCKRCRGDIPCPKICRVNSCDCKPGFVYDDNTEKCVLPKKCTPTCGLNEVYSNCSNSVCGPKNCSQLGTPIACSGPEPCTQGCICIDNYVRADNGTCIPKDDCACGGDPNAQTGCGVFCLRCSNYNGAGAPSCPGYCELNGCECRPGFIYDGNIGKCVLPKNCTPTCSGENEIYSNCTNAPTCAATNCSQLGKPIPSCGGPYPDVCYKGCLCRDGYLRADNGTCIPTSQCPSCNDDPNAESGCGTFCANCANPKPDVCADICLLNGCQCKNGFIYDQNIRKCVLPSQCTPTCNGPYEMFSNCTNAPTCDARNCSGLGKPTPSCGGPDPDVCTVGCVCQDGYLRADNGTCIPRLQCPSCNDDPNAESGCGTFCTKCSNYKNGPAICPLFCKLNGCQCKKGFIYDQNIQKCVLPENCTPTCKENEEYNCLVPLCSPRNCSEVGGPRTCNDPAPGTCKKGCACISGYLRANNGTCIPIKDCPCAGDPNAMSGCGGFCKRCSNYKNPVPCPPSCRLGGCDCRFGFIYDDNTHKCVVPSDCTPTCKANEVYSDCINGGCDARNCSQLGKPVPCVKLDPKACIKGCICAPEYLRADNGTCIKRLDCPACNDDPNAESGCGTFCARCSNPKPKACPASCMLNGCECKKGYIYNQNTKKCVLPEQCPCEGDENAELGGCSTFCVRCSNYKDKPKCPILQCIAPGCKCRKGFIYDEKIQKCVRPEDCTSTCKVNEVYSNCSNAGCKATNCSQIGIPISCAPEQPCTQGCVCKDGYVRSNNGTCVLISECPCKGDENAELGGCSTFCVRCSNYKNKPKCPVVACIVPGCECRKGFIYDENILKCVRPKDCTSTCKVNEVYSNCSNAGCKATNCSQIGIPISCAPEQPCTQGCVCKDGYVRSTNGTCILISECPCKGDENAELGGCSTFCIRCSNYKNKPKCPVVNCIVPGCECRKGFIYDEKIRKCVRPKDCTPTCKANEVYSDCINGGCDARKCSQLGKPVPCIKLDPKACIKGCVCAPGYLRADNGTCINKLDCPSCNDDPNAESGCGTFCARCSNPKPQACAASCILNGCECKKGYIYDQNINKCVLPKQCSNCSGINEIYDPCPSICDPQTCESIGKKLRCPLVKPSPDGSSCKGACRCKDGYARNTIGQCISETECKNCTKGHEYFSCGVACDNICATLSQQNQTHCPILTRTCVRQCYCDKGYARDSNGTCIPIEQCPAPTCKPNEEYNTCANGLCRLQNCTQFGQPIPFCPAFDTTKCKGGCVCLNKFLRTSQGKCVPQNDCPEAQFSTTTTTMVTPCY